MTGSVSGAHTGTVVADSDGDGGSFIPATPFAPGETVTVSTSLNIEGSGNGSYQFVVATPAGTISPAKRPAAPRVSGDVWTFRSRPDLAPAAVKITKGDPSATGDIFLAPQVGPIQQGPELIGPGGGLIWFNPVSQNEAATDFRKQYYQGQPVLTWWQGNEAAGVGSGQDMILNSSYQVVKVVSAGNGLAADLHEFQLTPGGTALITAEYPVIVNATSVKGATNEVVLDSVVQEIDVATGLVEFQWDSLDHVPLAASYSGLPSKAHVANGIGNPFDYFHLNSIVPDKDGNLVVSARNTWAVYKVNSRDRGDHVDAGRQELELQARTGRIVRVPARRPGAGVRRPVPDVVRRRRGAAVRALPVACAQAGAESQAQDRGCCLPARALATPPVELRGQLRAARPTGTTSSAGGSSRTSASTTLRASWCSTVGSSTRTSATAPTASTGAGSRRRPPRSRLHATAAR